MLTLPSPVPIIPEYLYEIRHQHDNITTPAPPQVFAFSSNYVLNKHFALKCILSHRLQIKKKVLVSLTNSESAPPGDNPLAPRHGPSNEHGT